MDYSKFYTPPEIANLLVRLLDIPTPPEVVDICCGSCNLLHAAGNRWRQTILHGVDVIKHASNDVTYVQADGRAFAIKHASKYSLVLANPPFDSIEAQKQNEYPELYSKISFKYHTCRLEVEMLLANLWMLKHGGTLMIIMPVTFVAATSHIKIRKYLGKEYHIQKIIHLPKETFGSSKISSCAIVFKHEKLKHQYTKRYYVTYKNGKYDISASSIIPQALVREGKWDDKPLCNRFSFDYEYRRGTISSQFFVESGIPVLHTAKTQAQWKPSVRYVKSIVSKAVFAEYGDIIVSRIGKSAGSWYRYTENPIMVSDCLYVIKDPTGSLAQRLFNRQYPYELKGVATRYITMADFGLWLSVSALEQFEHEKSEVNYSGFLVGN